jgi:hypothetical protein
LPHHRRDPGRIFDENRSSSSPRCWLIFAVRSALAPDSLNGLVKKIATLPAPAFLLYRRPTHLRD